MDYVVETSLLEIAASSSKERPGRGFRRGSSDDCGDQGNAMRPGRPGCGRSLRGHAAECKDRQRAVHTCFSQRVQTLGGTVGSLGRGGDPATILLPEFGR